QPRHGPRVAARMHARTSPGGMMTNGSNIRFISARAGDSITSLSGLSRSRWNRFPRKREPIDKAGHARSGHSIEIITMKFSIYRFDPDKDEKPYMQDYDVALEPA